MAEQQTQTLQDVAREALRKAIQGKAEGLRAMAGAIASADSTDNLTVEEMREVLDSLQNALNALDI